MNGTFLAQVLEEVQSRKVIKPKTLSQESLVDDAGDSSDESKYSHRDDDLFLRHSSYPVKIEYKSRSDDPVECEHV